MEDKDKELTPQEKRTIDKANFKFIFKTMWNGFQHGLMALLMNVILVLGSTIYFPGDPTASLVGCVLIGLFVANRFRKNFMYDLDKLEKTVKKLKEESDKIIKG